MSVQNVPNNEVPNSLRVWFKIHFVVDILFAIPLILFPVWFLELIGLPSQEVIMARLVGAALVGIGGTSFLTNKMSKNTFDAMLTLKLLWSSSAIIGFLISLFWGAPKLIWLFIFIFATFFLIWFYYKNKIR